MRRPTLPRFYHARSGNSLRAALAIELAGVAVERFCLDMATGEHRRPELLRLNAAGTVPVYVEESPQGRLVLAQSAAIAEHVLRPARPDLFPAEPWQAAHVQAAMHAAVGDIAVQNALTRYLAAQPDSVRFLRRRLLAMLRANLEGLKSQPYVCGPWLTIADIAHYPVVHLRRPMLAAIGGFEHVLAWADRLRGDPRMGAAMERAIAYAGLEWPVDPADLEERDADV